MPSIFQEVTLRWGDKDYVVPPDRVMRAIALIEDHVTINQLSEATSGGKMPLVKISAAYAVVLRYAGANVSDEDVYDGMFNGAGQMHVKMMSAIAGLMGLMIPPGKIVELSKKEDAGAAAPGKEKPTAGGSSSKHTRSPSARGASSRRSSGG